VEILFGVGKRCGKELADMEKVRIGEGVKAARPRER
jgi:hypothetical protein